MKVWTFNYQFVKDVFKKYCDTHSMTLAYDFGENYVIYIYFFNSSVIIHISSSKRFSLNFIHHEQKFWEKSIPLQNFFISNWFRYVDWYS